MRKIASIAVFAILVSTVALAGHQVAPLDGTSWKLDLKPDDMTKDKGAEQTKPMLTFADGKLTMTGTKENFSAVSYVIEKTDDKKTLKFKAEQSSPTEGTSVWTGTVNDKSMEGQRIWTKVNGEVWTYTFQGKKID